MGKHNVTLHLTDEEVEWLKREADVQMRSIPNFIVWTLRQCQKRDKAGNKTEAKAAETTENSERGVARARKLTAVAVDTDTGKIVKHTDGSFDF